LYFIAFASSTLAESKFKILSLKKKGQCGKQRNTVQDEGEYLRDGNSTVDMEQIS
jgi:hypothetical protein